MEFLETSEGQLYIGVAVGLIAVSAAAYFLFSSKKPKVCLDPENFKEFKLVKRTQLSHNVAKFKFALPTPTSVLGLPIGQHISCRGKDSLGEEVIKPYTPTTLDSDVGYFELVIKMYPQGRMSHHFREMCEGDYLAVKGPKGRFKYQPGQVRAFGMLAGGSGITPMFQVTRAILENPNDKTKVHLIYANVTYEDILLKEQLDSLATNYSDCFKIYYVLNQVSSLYSFLKFFVFFFLLLFGLHLHFVAIILASPKSIDLASFNYFTHFFIFRIGNFDINIMWLQCVLLYLANSYFLLFIQRHN
ncbi:NADH--cytochrome b5 reductase 1-like isoform X2 [Olea europaea var. sylvestris]|uniref:NADH--cytochrome b5 reductase 1-like isoform X1 n=1 Tax=Olea europaea var. sylvestris TaxID=158386 RepID=UPI000C1CD66F|nr:NADH--cytochrome b5 reductase 1-like isoform X1 [Olea europaea var. sylvestris]XP_022863671.1 NADH--cytochrome b5 reductase 1-like isoform X1 [Olea europaea var. sylvestris]XP_022863672.1 NADH--cytochrome b5 reductase 1-like isoform X1 [Olea europaea var. sylvestris]XP_022863673.1 NADH--cytochrome b5 reductase 1-like isoform X1 [Olea europaea var. sylvestris]XP_022863674.1 NADH--cytochrome b5 reductase 1-like isoform X2 [Olea europaea var. sylvestris]XP_022863675.1 NADH--cytochrome b5 reduc